MCYSKLRPLVGALTIFLCCLLLLCPLQRPLRPGIIHPSIHPHRGPSSRWRSLTGEQLAALRPHRSPVMDGWCSSDAYGSQVT